MNPEWYQLHKSMTPGESVGSRETRKVEVGLGDNDLTDSSH
jgi:hypothetical protein